MKYPRIPKEKWAKKVLLPQEAKEIKDFFFACKNYRLTARTFGVSRSVIIRVVDPERAKERDARARVKVLERYHTDPEFRQKMIAQNSKTAMQRKNNFPEIKKFDMESQKIRNKINPEPHRRQMRETYGRHKRKYLAQMQKKYYRDMSPEKKLDSYIKHKHAVESLLEAEPLLILFK